MFTHLCVAVLALCLHHHLSMATLGHASVMGSSHDSGMIAPHGQPAAMLAARDPGTTAGHELPSMPLPLPGDCLAQQAVFPLLVVLTLLLGLVLLAGEQGGRRAARRARLSRAVLAPLMPPRQRHALLQVFTI